MGSLKSSERMRCEEVSSFTPEYEEARHEFHKLTRIEAAFGAYAKAAEDSRSPRPCGGKLIIKRAEASWTAVLGRFGTARSFRNMRPSFTPAWLVI